MYSRKFLPKDENRGQLASAGYKRRGNWIRNNVAMLRRLAG